MSLLFKINESFSGLSEFSDYSDYSDYSEYSEYSDYSEYSEYSEFSKPFRLSLTAHRSSLIVHRSSIHLLPPLFYEGLHVGGYFALEIHLLACSGMGET